MEEIIGRIEERKQLEEILRSKRAEFIAVFGRRRVGKTFLIRTFFSGKSLTSKGGAFFHITGIQDGHLQDQLYEFTRTIEATFYGSQIRLKEPPNWTQAFELLTNIIKQQSPKAKVVLFFDELPWLATQKSGFIQALDYYWNRFWSTMPEIKLIVCGSAASWIIDNILHHKGGLHNRVTGRISLDPFNLNETKAYLKSMGFSYTDQQIMDLYITIGGIPYYLNFLNKKLSVAQNIDKLCFNKKGALVEEFGILFASLFHHSEAHQEIVRLMAERRQGIEKTALLKMSKFSSDGGTFNKRLRELETSGFVVSFTPYGAKKRNTYFRIADEYTLFYLAWIEPALLTIKKIDKANRYWNELSQTPSWKSWAGYAFEALCFKHIEQIRTALGINPSAALGSWKYSPKKGSEENGAQIDLLFDRNDDVITVCEMKYNHAPYKLTKPEAQVLLKKVEVFKKKTHTAKQITIALITPLPIQKSMYSEELICGNVTMSELMRPI